MGHLRAKKTHGGIRPERIGQSLKTFLLPFRADGIIPSPSQPTLSPGASVSGWGRRAPPACGIHSDSRQQEQTLVVHMGVWSTLRAPVHHTSNTSAWPMLFQTVGSLSVLIRVGALIGGSPQLAFLFLFFPALIVVFVLYRCVPY